MLEENWSLEIEDFGDKTLLHYVKKSKNKLSLYKKCVDVILKIQKIKPVKKIKFSSNKYINLNSYNTASLHKESNLFFDWLEEKKHNFVLSFKFK